MQSLRDKLLKAGLVSEEAARKNEHAAEKPAAQPAAPRRDERPPRARPAPASRKEHSRPERREEPPGGRVPKFAPLPGSKEAHRQQAKQQLELAKKLRERVLATQVPQQTGDTPFYFVTRKNTLRRLELTAAQAKSLETGELAVVERHDPDKIDHALVPAEVARELHPLHPKVVRFLNTPGAAVGFLSEGEISTRAHEAEHSHDADEVSEGAPLAEAPTTPDPAAAAASPAEPETWVTIKRTTR